MRVTSALQPAATAVPSAPERPVSLGATPAAMAPHDALEPSAPYAASVAISSASIPSLQALATVLSEPLPERRLPPLEEALADPSFEALDPATRKPPETVLDRIAAAKHVLVVGHATPPPDGDCVGSLLGLGRGLRALGKEVDLCADDVLSGQVRGLDPTGDIQRYDAIAGRSYDLVIVADVGEASRTGAATAAIAAAPSVVVIDHHNAVADRKSLGLAEGTPLATWVDPGCPAASLQIAGLIGNLAAESKSALSVATWKSVAEPMLAGTLTDTGFFRYEGIDEAALRQFKGLLTTRYDGDLAALKAKLTYNLPVAAAGVLADPPTLDARLDAPDAAALRTEVQASLGAGSQVHVDVTPGATLGLITVPSRALELATRVAQLDDPRANLNDAIGYAKATHLYAAKKSCPIAVMLTERQGRIACEIRSDEAGPALELAKALGGGGHPRAAGAQLDGTLEQASARVRDWVRRWELERDGQARAGRAR